VIFFPVFSLLPRQMDKASELQHCSMSWLQLSTMLSSWTLSHEMPRKRASCSTRVPRSSREGNHGRQERWRDRELQSFAYVIMTHALVLHRWIHENTIILHNQLQFLNDFRDLKVQGTFFYQMFCIHKKGNC